MEDWGTRGMGWQRDLKDARDYHPDHAEILELLDRLDRRRTKRSRLPLSADLREYQGAVQDQGRLNASTAFAVMGLVEYFEARATGRVLHGSHLFVYQMALKLLRLSGNVGVDLRTTFKALVRFGTPPVDCWPYHPDRLRCAPTDAFLFAFAKEYEAIRYFRLDAPEGEQTLQVVKSYLAAGFAVVFGFSVPSSVTAESDVDYRPQFDSICGGQAVLAVGYDDQRRIASEKGALLFRGSWGAHWGEQGYGWLPYRFVREHFAGDFWTAVRLDWAESGSLSQPTIFED